MVAILRGLSGRGLTGKVTSVHRLEGGEGISLAEIWGKREEPAPRATGKSMPEVCKEAGRPELAGAERIWR